MSTVEHVLKSKNRLYTSVLTVSPRASVLEAARIMNQHRIGSLVVLGEDQGVAGIFTERDVLTRVVAVGKDPARTHVSEVMTTPVVCCSPETPLNDLRLLMRQRLIRHVPVVEEDRLVGMVSIGDLNVAETMVLSQTIQSLEEYITRG